MVRIQFLYEKEQNMNAAEIIKKDLDAIYIGNLSTVDDDLTLPENGKYGAQFTWETGEEEIY